MKWSPHELYQCPYQRGPKRHPRPFWHVRFSEKVQHELGLSQVPTLLVPPSPTSQPSNCEKCISVACRSPSPRYLVTAAQTDPNEAIGRIPLSRKNDVLNL
jgi:hypothetical protein